MTCSTAGPFVGALGGGSPKAMGGQDPDLWPEGPHRLGVDSASTGGMEDGPPDSGGAAASAG